VQEFGFGVKFYPPPRSCAAGAFGELFLAACSSCACSGVKETDIAAVLAENAFLETDVSMDALCLAEKRAVRWKNRVMGEDGYLLLSDESQLSLSNRR